MTPVEKAASTGPGAAEMVVSGLGSNLQYVILGALLVLAIFIVIMAWITIDSYKRAKRDCLLWKVWFYEVDFRNPTGQDKLGISKDDSYAAEVNQCTLDQIHKYSHEIADGLHTNKHHDQFIAYIHGIFSRDGRRECRIALFEGKVDSNVPIQLIGEKGISADRAQYYFNEKREAKPFVVNILRAFSSRIELHGYFVAESAILIQITDEASVLALKISKVILLKMPCNDKLMHLWVDGMETAIFSEHDIKAARCMMGVGRLALLHAMGSRQVLA
jgi:hypothetical protein